ncbi:hypothetical protein AC578_2241 [Pseudocercospora eumusae]|uniref:Uncharacterized protein n=1 Tax=Pseudocercospora eumusae TaxID=321146 RepID=A0A139GWQ7_9PEZI|nr:hypothetical protein AC578_2241 [Pseudocercospora eumusae]
MEPSTTVDEDQELHTLGTQDEFYITSKTDVISDLPNKNLPCYPFRRREYLDQITNLDGPQLEDCWLSSALMPCSFRSVLEMCREHPNTRSSRSADFRPQTKRTDTKLPGPDSRLDDPFDPAANQSCLSEKIREEIKKKAQQSA